MKKDPTKLYIYIPQGDTPKKSRADKRDTIRLLKRESWKEVTRMTCVTTEIEKADIAICFSDISLQKIKAVRGDLYCLVSPNVDPRTLKGGLVINFFELEWILGLIILGFQLREDARLKALCKGLKALCK